MKMTLLEIVQSTLSSMDSDSVNNIGDTIESSQVTEVAKEVYYELMSYRDWDHLYKWIKLEALSGSEHPNYLRIPDSVGRMESLRYETTAADDIDRKFTEICYKSPAEFIDIVHSRNSSGSNIVTVTNPEGVDMFIKNDSPPTYWTSFDNEHIVTDSYDSDVDNTLQSSKSSAWCRVQPIWQTTDTFTPELPDEFFPAYLAEVKSTSHIYFKQQVSQKDEQKARRGLAHVERKERFDRGSKWVKLGRHS